MLRTQISKATIDLIAEEIRIYFDPTVLAQGLELQQKGYVYNANVEANTYKAKVQDLQTYDVTLNLEFLVSSECSCAFEGYCRHMAAAFFYAYANYGHPDAFVKALQQPGESGKTGLNHSSLHRITAMTELTPPSHIRIPTETDAPDMWLRYLDIQYERFEDNHRNKKSFLDEYCSAFLQNVTSPVVWWNTNLKKLFGLYCLFYVMRHADRVFLARHSEIKPDTFQKVNKFCLDRFVQTIKEINWSEALHKHRDHVRAIAEAVGRETFADGDSLADWLYYYRAVWSKLYGDALWTQEEAALLEQQLARTGGRGRHYDLLLLARGHFDILAGDDTGAMRRFEQLSRVSPDDFLIYLHTFSHQQNWPRLLDWLRWLLPVMRTTEQAHFNLICDYWNTAIRHQSSDAEWISALNSLMPRSYQKLAQYLMQSRQYKAWVNLHLAYEVSPVGIPSSELKTMEGEAPAMLLPLYHQAIEREIVRKTRDAYKTAVKWLRKLQTLYEAAGQRDRFDPYMRRLTIHYGRLRAFQEELRKGRLV